MTPPPNFNRLANLYRWMEWFTFGPWLCRSRLAFLPELAACRHALVLGDGDGRFTARLLRANSTIRIEAVDASPAMLKALVRNAGPNACRVRIHCADARLWETPYLSGDLPGNPPYDLVATHFFLDCLTTQEIRSLAMRLRRSVSPSASWLVSEFAAPLGWFGRMVASPIVWMLYRLFGALTGLAARSLPDHRTALLESGFALQKRRKWLGGLLASELWSFTDGESPGTHSQSRSTPIEMLQTC